MRQASGRLVMAAALGAAAAASAAGQIRVVIHNVLDGPTNASQTQQFVNVYDRIADDVSRIDAAGPNDRLTPAIVMLQEAAAFPAGNLRTALNDLYGTDYGTLSTAGSPANDEVVILYDRNRLELVQGLSINTSGPRNIPRALLRPIGYDSGVADFYAYATHFKAGSSSSDFSRRAGESEDIRQNMDALGQGACIIFGGDLNLQGTFEDAWQNLIAPGNGQLFDPLNGQWSGSALTQDPQSGLDDRFDIILTSEEVDDGDGFDLIDGSYFVYGNSFGQVTDPDTRVTDHLPVVADFVLPALPSVAVRASTVAPRVIVGGETFGQALIENQGTAEYSWGVGVLRYRVLGPGFNTASVTGSLTGDDGLLILSVPVDTSVPAVKTGSVVVQLLEGAADQNVFQSSQATVTVLEPASASFAPSMPVTQSAVDFGEVEGGSPVEESVAVFNLARTDGLGSAMDIDSIELTGDVDAFDVSLIGLDSVEPGGMREIVVAFDPAQASGEVSAVVTIAVSDEDVPGETSRTLMLALSGEPADAAACEGDVNEDGQVTIADVLFTIARFGQGGVGAEGDANNDAQVTIADVLFIIARFGNPC